MDIQAIKNACSAKGWESIFSNFSGLRDALEKGTRHQPCPKTGEGKDRFRFFKDVATSGGGYHNDVGAMPDGIELLSWYTDKGKGEVLKMLVEMIGGDKSKFYDLNNQSKVSQKPREYCTPAESERRSKIIAKVFSESVPIQGTLAETYLKSRGIKSFTDSFLADIGNNLRFHESLAYREDDNSLWQRFPSVFP